MLYVSKSKTSAVVILNYFTLKYVVADKNSCKISQSKVIINQATLG